jgi:hypothetical protein
MRTRSWIRNLFPRSVSRPIRKKPLQDGQIVTVDGTQGIVSLEGATVGISSPA